MPTLRQLEYLVAVAEERNFRRAAERVHTTQPTLSEQLKALEERLGVQLVERTRSRVALTPIGIRIVAVARRMLADANDIKALAASDGDELTGVLRIGLPPTIGPYLLASLIPEFKRVYPGLKLYIREELPSRLPGGLIEGAHDLIVTLLPVRSREIVTLPLFREPLRLAVVHSHPLGSRDGVRRADLEGLDVLTLAAGHQLHDAVNGLCEEVGARLRLDYEGTSLDTLREMVATGLGVTFLPELYVRAVASRDASIRLLDIVDLPVFRVVALAWRHTSPRQDRYRALGGLIRAIVAREYVGLHVLHEPSTD